jgi:hypothetical protein
MNGTTWFGDSKYDVSVACTESVNLVIGLRMRAFETRVHIMQGNRDIKDLCVVQRQYGWRHGPHTSPPTFYASGRQLHPLPER